MGELGIVIGGGGSSNVSWRSRGIIGLISSDFRSVNSSSPPQCGHGKLIT